MARRFGWEPGARYTNLRDVRDFAHLAFLDIHWRSYSFERHLAAARLRRPDVTVARDLLRAGQLSQVLAEAEELLKYCKTVIIVPKARGLARKLTRVIPSHFVFGYSVPSAYGETGIDPAYFEDRPTHLLGGRPDIQLAYASKLNTVSADCNRFTIDAAFGKYFDGERFRRHPKGGYDSCIRDSLRSINQLWRAYDES